MTVGELYTVAGPCLATVYLVFAPIGLVVTVTRLLEWLLPVPSLCKCEKCGHLQYGDGLHHST